MGTNRVFQPLHQRLPLPTWGSGALPGQVFFQGKVAWKLSLDGRITLAFNVKENQQVYLKVLPDAEALSLSTTTLWLCCAYSSVETSPVDLSMAHPQDHKTYINSFPVWKQCTIFQQRIIAFDLEVPLEVSFTFGLKLDPVKGEVHPGQE